MDLDTVADELYALPREEFVDVRERRSQQARSRGQPDLASAIRQLRKPTVSAWVVNLLVRDRAEAVDRLLRLGEDLREAQTQLRGEDLRRLSEQRSRVVGALAEDGGRLAEAAGHAVSESVQREVEGTLEAALADVDAARQLRAGRLTTALSYSGLGPGTAGEEAPARRRTSEATALETKAARRHEVRAPGNASRQAAIADARQALRDAKRDARALERALERAERDESARRSRAKRTDDRVAEAERELARAQSAAAACARELDRVLGEKEKLGQDIDAARGEVQRAEARLDRETSELLPRHSDPIGDRSGRSHTPVRQRSAAWSIVMSTASLVRRPSPHAAATSAERRSGSSPSSSRPISHGPGRPLA